MRTIVVGGLGQLGRALVNALTVRGHTADVWDVPEYDITSAGFSAQLAQARPDAVINAAAWTNVDAAEQNPEGAYRVNALGARFVADGCAACDALLLHVSTNEVFPGEPGRFYFENDPHCPSGVYARSKAAGEAACAAAHRRLIIARIAWLFGAGGNNFPTKIVAAADKLGSLRVVSDEIGNPTYAPDAADAMVRMLELGRTGTVHLVNDGFASRHELAEAVLQASGRGHVPVAPISVSEWVRASPPPLHAVLVNQAAAGLGVRLRPWREAVDEYAATLATSSQSAPPTV